MGNATAGPLGNATAGAEDTGFLGDVNAWFDDPQNAFWARLIATGVTFLLAWLVVKLTERALTRSAMRMARHRRFDEYQTKVVIGRTKPMRMIVKVLAFALVGIALVGVWGLTTAFMGLLAGAGFAGIVIGLAAADTIGDVIAGFLIFYNHPFDIGDWVEIDGVQGFVEDVALGATTLITFDNEKITIPNGVVEGGKVKNFSHARRLRIRIPVGVEYGTDIDKALKLLKEIGASQPDVLKVPEPLACAMGFGASSVDLQVRVWIEPMGTSLLTIQTDIIRMIHDRFRAEGIGIAFPHMQIVQGRPFKVDVEAE